MASETNIIPKETYRNNLRALQSQGFSAGLRDVSGNSSNIEFASCVIRQETADDRATLLSSGPENDDDRLGHIYNFQNWELGTGKMKTEKQ